MNINTKEMQTVIQHEVDVAVMLATAQVTEVTPKKYSEITGISYEKVMNWCKNKTLQARKVNADGVQVESGGSWLIDIKAPILAKNS